MAVTHTPGPWFLLGNDVCIAGPFVPTYADDPEQMTAGIAHCGMRLRQPEEAAANARHIVRCVNSHAELLAACEMLAKMHALDTSDPAEVIRPIVVLGSEQLKQLNDAIAKAKGGAS